MTDRFRGLQRILAVQTKLHRLAQWKLAELERHEEALRDKQERLLRFLDEEASYTALFGNTLMRRLRNVGEEKAQALLAKNEQAEKTLEESRRVGQMERLVDDLSDSVRRDEERKELRDILEQTNHRRNASLR